MVRLVVIAGMAKAAADPVLASGLAAVAASAARAGTGGAAPTGGAIGAGGEGYS